MVIPAELTAEFVMVRAAPRSTVRVVEIWSGRFVVTFISAKVFVEPDGAESASLWIVKFVAGVAASMVIVFVFGLVIRINVKVEFGAWLLDQFVPIRQRSLTVLVQLFVVAAWIRLPNPSKAAVKMRVVKQKRAEWYFIFAASA